VRLERHFKPGWDCNGIFVIFEVGATFGWKDILSPVGIATPNSHTMRSIGGRLERHFKPGWDCNCCIPQQPLVLIQGWKDILSPVGIATSLQALSISSLEAVGKTF